jgi:IS5 family transposase
MSRQTSFADLDYARKKRQTRREIFLSEMEAVVPWAALLQRIAPITPRAGGGAASPWG